MDKCSSKDVVGIGFLLVCAIFGICKSCMFTLSSSIHSRLSSAMIAASSSELGWSCLPLAVETHGNWGKEAVNAFALLARRIAMHSGYARSKVTHDLYSKMNLTLTRSIAELS